MDGRILRSDCEEILAAFEMAWKSGQIPSIEQALAAYTGSAKTELMRELVLVDMEFRWRTSITVESRTAGLSLRPRLQDYFVRYSDLGLIEALPAHLLAEEYRIRATFGDRPNWDQFLSQYPDRMVQLIPLLAEIDEERKVDSEVWDVEVPVEVVEHDVTAPLRYVDYTLQQLLGAGGMGRVYVALRKSDQKRVTVKALRKSLQTNSRAVRQFVQEARLLARMDHPHIVRVHGLGRFPRGGYFIVMDFVNGTTLQSRLNGGPLSGAESVRIVRTTAEAIRYSHELGVVHCDLKPANILLTNSGEPVVTDFGLAQFLGDRGATARTIGGTHGYIAPEILVHGASAISSAVDVYGLGALLVALLTGSPPSCGVDRNLKTQLSNLPPSLASICKKCLEEEPLKRFSGLSELIDMLKS